jgi:hypothetical protein
MADSKGMLGYRPQQGPWDGHGACRPSRGVATRVPIPITDRTLIGCRWVESAGQRTTTKADTTTP